MSDLILSSIDAVKNVSGVLRNRNAFKGLVGVPSDINTIGSNSLSNFAGSNWRQYGDDYLTDGFWDFRTISYSKKLR